MKTNRFNYIALAALIVAGLAGRYALTPFKTKKVYVTNYVELPAKIITIKVPDPIYVTNTVRVYAPRNQSYDLIPHGNVVKRGDVFESNSNWASVVEVSNGWVLYARDGDHKTQATVPVDQFLTMFPDKRRPR